MVVLEEVVMLILIAPLIVLLDTYSHVVDLAGLVQPRTA
jgi:hypothetical protein